MIMIQCVCLFFLINKKDNETKKKQTNKNDNKQTNIFSLYMYKKKNKS
jgi:hypothetical protein